MAIAKAASDKKALDIVTLDMRKVPSVSDYFVIASGSSTTQVRAISENIADILKETRRFYELEKLWGKAPKKKFSETRIKQRVKVRRKSKKAVKRSTGNKKRQNVLWRNRKRGRPIS